MSSKLLMHTKPLAQKAHLHISVVQTNVVGACDLANFSRGMLLNGQKLSMIYAVLGTHQYGVWRYIL